MKALTLWQPWASLVACGAKRIETRCWSTKYRGPLAIHAAKNGPPFRGIGESQWRQNFRAQAEQHGIHLAPACMSPALQWVMDNKRLPTGAVLCTVNLVDVQEITAELAADLTPQERIFGNYEPGRYAWFLERRCLFESPIAAKGNRLLWNWERP